jgi:hypothetical protein
VARYGVRLDAATFNGLVSLLLVVLAAVLGLEAVKAVKATRRAEPEPNLR